MALQDLADEELRRKQGGIANGGGIGGAQAQPGMMLPFLTGARQVYDFSQNMAGGAAQPGNRMGQGGPQEVGPWMRHAMRQGIDFPGVDTQNPVGGPNIAPGAPGMQALIQNMQGPPPWANALENRQGSIPPGLSNLVGGGNTPPQTQGWRNYAPGFGGAASLGYGTPEFGQRFGVGGLAAGAGTQRGGPGFGQPGGGMGGGVRQQFAGAPAGGPRPGPGGGPAASLGLPNTGPAGGPQPIGRPGGGPGSSAQGPGPGGGGGGGRGGGGGGGNQGSGGGGGGPQLNSNSPGAQQLAAHEPQVNAPNPQPNRPPNGGNNNTPSELNYNTTPQGGGGQPNKPPRRNTRPQGNGRGQNGQGVGRRP